MRLISNSLVTESTRLMILDPNLFSVKEADTAIIEPYGLKEGRYKVLSNGNIWVVAIYPNSFRGKYREGYSEIGTVTVRSGTIGIVEECKIDEITTDILRNEYDITKIELKQPGEHSIWFEEKEWNCFKGIVGVGERPTMIINGKDADQILVIEKMVAKLLRAKGHEKKTLHAEIVERMTTLHQAGCKDDRLQRLAMVARVDLPKKTRANKAR